MSDLIQRLRALARAEHSDLSVADEAADALQHAGQSQPVVSEGHILVSVDLFEGALHSLREAAKHANIEDKIFLSSHIKLFDEMLSAAKEILPE